MMTRPVRTMLSIVLALPMLALMGCGGVEEQRAALPEQAPPPADPAAAPAPPPPPAEAEREPERAAPRPAPRMASEDDTRLRVPPPPATVTLTLPAGTPLALVFREPMTSATAAVGDAVTAELKNPVIVGERVVFPAGSRVEGAVTDVKSASKGFKETGGALAIGFDRIVGPDGRKATIAASFTSVAEGSGKKKAAIIGGSAVGGALLGKALGKDTEGAALVGGAIGTAVAGSTRGVEAKIEPDQEIAVALEAAARVTVKR